YLQDDNEQDAISEFLIDYVKTPLAEYTGTVQSYMRELQEGEISRAEQNRIEQNIIVLTLVVVDLLQDNAKIFVGDVYAPFLFEKYGIESVKLQQSILKATLAQFEELIFDAMSKTKTNVLTNIRNMQRQFIVENQKLRKFSAKMADRQLNREVVRFKKELKKVMPEYYDAIESGNILKSRSFGKDGERVIRYRLDSYAEMSMRTTLLNVDRTAVEVVEESKGQELVEYYQRDFRPLKSGKEREICKSILANKILGKSLLALNSEVASKYGVMSIQDARAEGAMGVWCRHSIRSVSKSFMKKLDSMKAA
ncbi:MAG: hypothetical protein KOO69_04265, partial [Victivallales bacterium]|nr:hypothetical protein [Victivallales bacterium]